MAGLASRRWISLRRSEAQPAIDTALRFLAQRPRSEQEVRRRLRRAHLDEPTIESTVARLRESRLLDDAEFARYWVEQRQTFRPRGARLLRAELARLGVDRGVAADVVGPDAEDQSGALAYRAAQKRAAQLAGCGERAFKTRLSQWLARRGFDWGTIAPIIDRLWSEQSALSTSSGSARAPMA